METLNYESALDKFSSVCSFKDTPPPPSPEELGGSGGGGPAARAGGGDHGFPCALVFLARSVAVAIRERP